MAILKISLLFSIILDMYIYGITENIIKQTYR
jgi:hypothetical protein